MKKMMILAVMMVMTISANAMSYNAAFLDPVDLQIPVTATRACRWYFDVFLNGVRTFKFPFMAIGKHL